MDQGPSPAPLTAGQVLEGKYRVGRALGGGAMGIVYEAHHLLLDKPVALKVLRPELATNPDVRDRFLAEARAAAAIGHPNIVAVTDLGRTPDGGAFFVMDRLQGETLGDRLERGPIEVHSAVGIAIEVLEGLAAAHDLGLLHRDIKPDNIFLARAPGGREVAKILDFGVAKALAEVGKRERGTKTGYSVGTPQYMAPEQAAGAADMDVRVDIYALGVVLYHMLAGQPPFNGNDVVEVLTAVIQGKVAPLARACPDAPRVLIAVVESAMDRDRERRPGSALELSRALKDAISAAPAFAASVPASGARDSLSALSSPVLVAIDGEKPAAAPPGWSSQAPPLQAPRRVEPTGTRKAPLPAPESPAPGLSRSDLVPFAQDPHVRAPDRADSPGHTGLELARPRTSAGTMAPPGQMAPLFSARLIKKLVSGIALVFAVGGGVVAVRAFLRRDQLGKIESAVGSAANQVRAAASKVAQEGEAVMISFDVQPKTARIFLDGAPLSSNPLRIPMSDVVHVVTADADGYSSESVEFLANRPQTVRLRLERIRKAR